MSSAMTFEEKDVKSEKRGKYIICIIGCGRIGLQTSYFFAKAGFKVISVDVNHDVKSLLKNGTLSIIEKNLNILLSEHLKNGNITMTKNAKKSVLVSDIIIFILRTPFDPKKKPNYLRIEQICKEVGVNLRSGSLIIVEGTVAPGITETLIRNSLEDASGLQAGVDFGLAYISINSKRAIQDIITHPIIVGGINKQSLKVACLVLSTITKVGENNGSIN